MPTIQSTHLALDVSLSGAEMTSLRSLQDGTEYLWQADPSIWARHAPVLFPIVGRLKNDQYRYQGETYSLGQHGFARDKEFLLAEQSEHALIFELRDDADTRQRYPFSFRFRIGYDLQGDRLRTSYQVSNPGPGTLPFSVGAHPAFRCPLLPDEALTDYEIRFEQPETAAIHLLEGGLLAQEEPFLENQDRFDLTPHTFDRDALVFTTLQSAWVQLVSKKSGRGVELSLKGFPFLGIWAKPGGAPFVCLEPWQGIADDAQASGELLEKPGIRLLAPGADYSGWFDTRCF
jgi:galactose mutarotase-like enzyme